MSMSTVQGQVLNGRPGPMQTWISKNMYIMTCLFSPERVVLIYLRSLARRCVRFVLPPTCTVHICTTGRHFSSCTVDVVCEFLSFLSLFLQKKIYKLCSWCFTKMNFQQCGRKKPVQYIRIIEKVNQLRR